MARRHPYFTALRVHTLFGDFVQLDQALVFRAYGLYIQVPADFVSDGCSFPRLARMIPRFNWAATAEEGVLHDYMSRYGSSRIVGSGRRVAFTGPREAARIFYWALLDDKDVSAVLAWAMHKAVLIAPARYWEKRSVDWRPDADTASEEKS